MREVEILDCTIRDGSYMINFQYSKKIVAYLVKGLAEARIPKIEVGHGVGFDAERSQYDPAKHSEEEYIKTASLFKNRSKIGHFFIPGIGKLENIEKSVEWGLDFIRIGTNITEIEKVKDAIKISRDCGLETSINLMKSYALPVEKFKEKGLLADKLGPDVICVVDSAGGMFPEDVREYVKSLKGHTSASIGYHGHNNLMMAMANSIAAIEEGAKVVDSSLLGMGRGGGNAQTEILATILSKKNIDKSIDIYKLMDLGEEYIRPLTNKLVGIQYMDVTAGLAQFHSSFLNRFIPIAEKYQIDLRDLIIHVSAIEKVSPSEELITQIAEKIISEQEQKRDIKYPRKVFLNK